jgi:hypothetical protein
VEGLSLIRQDPEQVLVNCRFFFSVAAPEFLPVPGLFSIDKLSFSSSLTGSGSGRVQFGIGTGVRFRIKRVSVR